MILALFSGLLPRRLLLHEHITVFVKLLPREVHTLGTATDSMFLWEVSWLGDKVLASLVGDVLVFAPLVALLVGAVAVTIHGTEIIGYNLVFQHNFPTSSCDKEILAVVQYGIRGTVSNAPVKLINFFPTFAFCLYLPSRAVAVSGCCLCHTSHKEESNHNLEFHVDCSLQAQRLTDLRPVWFI